MCSKEVVRENDLPRGIHPAYRIKCLEALGNHRITAVSILFLHGCSQTLLSMSEMSGTRLVVGGDLVTSFHRQ